MARLAAEGDSAAFEVIFRRYRNPLYRYCHSIVGNEHDAMDALQSTMAAVLQTLPGERRVMQLKPWLYRIAHNEAIEIVRGRRPQEELDDSTLGTAESVDVTADRRERLRQMVEDIRQLTEMQRGALLMRELNGLSYKEIALAFEITEPAAKQSVYKARQALLEIGEGREMTCEHVRQTISERDGRLLAGRGVRAHLRACEGCRRFREGIGERGEALQAVTPVLAIPLGAKLVAGVLGSGSHGGASGAATLAAAGAGKALGTSVALKALAIGAASVGLGAGVVVAEERIGSTSLEAAAERGAGAGAKGEDGEDAGPGAHGRARAREARERREKGLAIARAKREVKGRPAGAGEQKSAAGKARAAEQGRGRPDSAPKPPVTGPPPGTSEQGSSGRETGESQSEGKAPEPPSTPPAGAQGAVPPTGEAPQAPDVPGKGQGATQEARGGLPGTLP